MPRPLYPPQGFTCAYTHGCPYLDGLSTAWVFGEYRRAGDAYQEHMRIMDELQAELGGAQKHILDIERKNAELTAKLTALQRRQFKPNKKQPDGKARAEDAASGQEGIKKKKRGAPVGHPAWTRPKPDHIDHTVFVPAPTICPHCSSDKLTPAEEQMEHIQEDIAVRPRTIVTRYIHEQAHCTRCNRPVAQAADGEILNAPIGPVAKSTAVYLRYGIGLSYRKAGLLFKDIFGLNFVPASAVGFDKRAAAKGEPIYDDLREKIRASDMLHADETSWRNDGAGHYAWYAGNKHLAFFHIDRHRSAKAAETIFGKDYSGILVRDRYAAYNGIGRDWQSCLAHIIRRAKEIDQEHQLLPDAQKDNGVKPFCEAVVKLLSNACEIGGQLQKGVLLWDNAARIETRLTKNLVKICKNPQSFKPAETLRSHLAGDGKKQLFTFLRNPGVPPTNNQAEQSIRSMVIFRKTSFGTRSGNGIKTHSILPSLVQTARRQGVHPRDFLQTLISEDTAKAQAALYQNSS